MFTTNQIIKYLIVILLLFLVLRFIPSVKVDLGTILLIIVLYLFIQFLVDSFIVTEGMMTDFSQGGEGRALPYNLNDQDDYYPFNENEPMQRGGIPYSMAPQLIEESKLNDLYNQHNFNIIWTPHTHIGKARGYMNWEDTYE